jgi:hypothetical protein
MSDYRPYDRWDYRVNDLLLGEDEPPDNRLLDEDGQAVRHANSGSIKGLSAIAATLDKYGPQMQPQHLEKAVWWLKDWKMHRSGWQRTISAPFDLHQSMERLKQSASFKNDGVKARRYSYASHLFAVLFGIAALGAFNAWFDVSSWGSRVGWTFGVLILSGLTAAFRDTARDIWQRQDRRYFLQCLRLCRCTEDLLDVGLFAYHPSTEQVRSAEEHLEFRRAVREMQVQLADSLYFDWDQRIREQFNEREQAFSWNWPKKTSLAAGLKH